MYLVSRLKITFAKCSDWSLVKTRKHLAFGPKWWPNVPMILWSIPSKPFVTFGTVIFKDASNCCWPFLVLSTYFTLTQRPQISFYYPRSSIPYTHVICFAFEYIHTIHNRAWAQYLVQRLKRRITKCQIL
jgi:hypothetical protein